MLLPPSIASLVRAMPPAATPDDAEAAYAERLVPRLVRLWIADYNRRSPSLDLFVTSAGDFRYLFDVKYERLIAAWGVSRGRHAGARDKARMAGHPLSAGPDYHRGHAIPHTLGGPTDINLVPQLGAVNVGPFRALERAAVATPGALYFTYWWYERCAACRAAGGRPEARRCRCVQTPAGVAQGLLRAGEFPRLALHGN
jgi:hypothetical protein